MNKKQFLSSVLAGLITFNTLVGCTINKDDTHNSDNSVVSEIIEETEPKIDVIPTNISGIRIRGMEVIENNIIITSINNDYKDNNEDYSNYIIIGNKSYNVVTQITLQYAASKFTKNGQTIYYAPYGGYLQDGMVTLEKTVQMTEENTLQILISCNYVTAEEINEYKGQDKLTKSL